MSNRREGETPIALSFERARNWWIGSDPGLLRLRSAVRTTAALACSLVLLSLLTKATGQPLTVALLGVVITMIAARSVNEPDPHQQRITMALLPVPGVIAMAGIMRIEDWHHPDTFLESAESTITTNVLGPIRLIAAFIEHLQKQPAATIITVSSGLAFAPLRVTASYNASKAAIHMLTESVRLQLTDSTVELKELVPPSVQTDLVPGQRDNPAAVPPSDFLDEVMQLLENEPDGKEIQVERVKFLRYGEARGDYDKVIAALNASDPHGK
jgi:short-subunit dehydrogenase involved in D-alanine esterification of teichoic acids